MCMCTSYNRIYIHVYCACGQIIFLGGNPKFNKRKKPVQDISVIADPVRVLCIFTHLNNPKEIKRNHIHTDMN